MRLIIFLYCFVCNSINTNAQLHIQRDDVNNTAWATEQNNYSDWIEIYNSSSDSVLLNSYFLSDDQETKPNGNCLTLYSRGWSFLVYA